MNQDLLNEQTQFAAESALYQTDEPDDQVLLTPQNSQLSSNAKIKKIVIIGVSIFFILILILVIFVKSRSTSPSQEEPETENTPLTQIETGPFTQRLVELNQALEQADPNQETLPFPPIKADISLEKK